MQDNETVKVRVYHNTSRDKDDRPIGMLDGYAPSHTLSLVDVLDWPTDNPTDDAAVLQGVYALFNIGDDPAFGTPDPRAVAYRARRNRSLSMGDVIAVDDRSYACTAHGWKSIDAPPGRWWELAPTGPQPSGDVGGDDQVSEAHSRRFARQDADGNWAVYEVTFYVVSRQEPGEAEPRTFVERQRYYAGCSNPFDPGADERWADYRYAKGTGTTEADAIAACAALSPDAIGWDGTEQGIDAAESA